MSEINSYPLHWPAGWERTKASDQKRANFNSKSGGQSRALTVADGIKRVLEVLQKMGIQSYQVIISTNMQVRNDGLPYSGRKDPDDAGAAIYWRPYGCESGTPHRCMAVDQYSRLADNLAAIAGSLDAMRAIERWGGAAILERAFTGFQALPETIGTEWWHVLEVTQDECHEAVTSSYKVLRSKYHPDRPTGDAEKFNQVQQAWQQYLDQKND